MPEITLRWVGSAPPTTLAVPPLIRTPAPPLPAFRVPEGSMPTKLPSILLPVAPGPSTGIPLLPKRPITRPLIVLSAAVIYSPLAVYPASAPLSCTFKTASLPSARVFGLAPGWL